MRRRSPLLLGAFALSVAASVFALTSSAAPPKKPAASAKPNASAAPSAKPQASSDPSASTLPPGHPSLDQADQGGQLPSGHPPIDPDDEDDDDDGPAPANPHGGGGMADPRFFQPPPDTATDDPSLPVGSLIATIKDAKDKPVPDVDVELGVLHSTVAKGESREKKHARADARGEVHFDNLDVGSGTTYRVVTTHDGATFDDQPFALGDKVGKRAVLHVYEASGNIDDAMVMEGVTIYMALREDVIQVDEIVKMGNVSPVAWIADAKLALPIGFKAFNRPEGMDDVRFDETKSGAALRGTISPGPHEANFRFQIPLEDVEKQTFEIELPPHVARADVIIEASKTMGLSVDGFPPAQPNRSRDGKRVLVTQSQITKAGGWITPAKITVTGLPTTGLGRWFAVSFAALAIIVGFAYLRGSQGGPVDDDAFDELVEAREALLGEVVTLERLHQKGEVGPKTYARLRAALLDSLARIVDRIDIARKSRHAEDKRIRGAA